MHIPVEKLPAELQEEVMSYLQTGNFLAAKNVRDRYEAELQRARLENPAAKLSTRLNSKASKPKNIASTI